MADQDLQSILANLARFTTPAQPVSNTDPYPISGSSVQTSYNPPSASNSESGLVPDLSQLDSSSRPLPHRTEDPRLRPQSRSTATASPKPVIDPATITNWQEGLRCVTKIAAQNAQFAASIRKMIEDQRKHELRWYSERQELKHTQAKRASSSAQAQSILQSLSGATTPSEAASKADNEAELLAFDKKIYAAQQAMEVAMIAELKRLGVPFCGTQESLIVPDGAEDTDQLAESQPKWSSKITASQLLELRRRMVQHLEDLYKD